MFSFSSLKLIAMEVKYGFIKMSISEFESWIDSLRVARTVLYVQHHHTYSPDYKLFKGENHFELQKGMKNYHVFTNGWLDLGQHFTIFPDGTVMTGRSLETTPACIFGNNSHSICIENLGNFDAGGDVMTTEQAKSILRVTAALCKKYNIPVDTSRIVYHHWFNLSNGDRNNGTGSNKSCPGTNFFGGNKVDDLAEKLLKYNVDEVLYAEHELLELYNTDGYTKVIDELIQERKPEILLIGATNIGRDLGPRISSRVHTGLTADCTELSVDLENRRLMQTRPAFGGNLMATIVCEDHRPQMSTVRPGVMEKAKYNEEVTGEIIKFTPDLKDEDVNDLHASIVQELRDRYDLIYREK